jgi:pyrroline-5-carboxylate reductase
MIGCGNMGQAMVRRWLDTDVLNDVCLTIVKPTPLPENICSPTIKWYSSLKEADLSYSPTIIWLAVKPQKMAEIVPTLPHYFSKETLYCSLAAGLTCSHYEALLGRITPILRIMPNTPVSIGKGVISMVANQHVTNEQKSEVEKFLNPLGVIVPLENESLMDAATAVAGSGTAYVYLFIEALMDAAIANGIDSTLAHAMAVQTVLGAAELALKEKNISLELLRAFVTSKGGTTEAALQQLEKNNALRHLIKEAASAAMARAQALK